MGQLELETKGSGYLKAELEISGKYISRSNLCPLVVPRPVEGLFLKI